MNVIIKCKTPESRKPIWELLTTGLKVSCDEIPGGYVVTSDHDADPDYIGVRCEKIHLFYECEVG